MFVLLRNTIGNYHCVYMLFSDVLIANMRKCVYVKILDVFMTCFATSMFVYSHACEHDTA